MDIQVKKTGALKQKTPCLVLGVFEGKLRTAVLREIDQKLDGALSKAVRDREFEGKARQMLLLHAGKALPAARVLFVGLGKEKEANLEGLRQAAGAVGTFLQGRKIGTVSVDLDSVPLKRTSGQARAQALTEGLLLATYRFDRYRTQKRDQLPAPFDGVALLVSKAESVEEAKRGVEEARIICQAVSLARDLVNEPGNVKSPEFLAGKAQIVAEQCGIACRVLDRSELEREAMGAMLGVAQGSEREPRFIVMEYNGGAKGQAPVVLVGKGVVFDAGGISLKPSEKMDEMKMDMAGGAAVIGALSAAAGLKLSVNLVGLIPAVENLPSGSAIRPGDILTSKSGKTIEVQNTDAEGRLILADALAYAQRYAPSRVIDLATLTGACIIALGHHASAVLGNHDGLVEELLSAGEASGERLWRLPLWDTYDEQIDSEIADVKNIGGRPAGTITAAAFLKRFAEEYDWAHLDIAGTAWEASGRPYIPKGGTGVGVRLLVEFLRQAKK